MFVFCGDFLADWDPVGWKKITIELTAIWEGTCFCHKYPSASSGRSHDSKGAMKKTWLFTLYRGLLNPTQLYI